MPLDGDIKQITEELARSWEDFKSKHEQEIREQKSGLIAAKQDFSKVEQAMDRLQAANDAFAAKMAAQEKWQAEAEKRLSRPTMGHNGGPSLDDEIKSFRGMLPARTEIDLDGYQAYKTGFVGFMRKNQQLLTADEVKALAVGVDSDGGYLVPADTSGRIATRVFETSPVRQIASTQTISTDALEGVRDTDEAGSGGWVSEQQSRPTTATPTLGTWRIPVHEMYAMPEATQQILDDAAVDVEAWLSRKVADRLTRVENAAFVTGDGVGKPRGFCAYPTAATADGSRPWGTIEHINTTTSGAFASSNPADVLFDVIGAVKDAYLSGARWVTRRSVVTLIRKFKEATTNGYLWQPGLQAGQPAQILGYPVTMAEDMPALGSGSLSMAFGNFAEAYQIVDRAGFRVLRDPYTNKPFVRFYTTRRVGGGVIQFEAIKFLRFGS